MSKSIKFKNNTYLDSRGIVHNKESLYNILNKRITGSFNIDAGSTYDFVWNLGSTALIDFKGTGSMLECGMLYYAQRTNMYYYSMSRIAYTQYNNTVGNLSISTSNDASGIHFKITNNNKNQIRFSWTIFLLH